MRQSFSPARWPPPLYLPPPCLSLPSGLLLSSPFCRAASRPSQTFAAFNRFAVAGAPAREGTHAERVHRRCPALAVAQLHLMLSELAHSEISSFPFTRSPARSALAKFLIPQHSRPLLSLPLPSPPLLQAARLLQCLSLKIALRSATHGTALCPCWPQSCRAAEPSTACLCTVAHGTCPVLGYIPLCPPVLPPANVRPCALCTCAVSPPTTEKTNPEPAEIQAGPCPA